ncbi:hypothetical protein DEO72_LG11g2129 [Vigna unguiculata]|uniref:Uncharacterized protein n=1 Tax=Vigna unguiculata TaxID=3917 RepID=A0A4D6NQB6_VIGUN|nr:hypothetical protein DEO72_LG11g2129 [Vigna unguiculata]
MAEGAGSNICSQPYPTSRDWKVQRKGKLVSPAVRLATVEAANSQSWLVVEVRQRAQREGSYEDKDLVEKKRNRVREHCGFDGGRRLRRWSASSTLALAGHE